MGHKDKLKYAYVGARVRVANDEYTGDGRWKHARTGVIVRKPSVQGASVLVEGEKFPYFAIWGDLDLDEKPRRSMLEIPLGEIRPSRWQYRRSFDEDALLELAQSINEHGLINAILVFKHEEGGFELIAGERRVRACAALALDLVHPGMNLKNAAALTALFGFWDDMPHRELIATSDVTIRAEVREGAPEAFHTIAVIENLQRENPSALEEAEAFNALMVQNEWTQSELATHLGKSAPYISQRLTLLGLAEETKAAVHGAEIPFASARAIASVPEAMQAAVTRQVRQTMASDEPATTRQVSALANQIKRFFDPERWQPGEDDAVTAETRNRYRLLRYHIEMALTSENLARTEALERLQNIGGSSWLGKQPGTVARDNHSTVQILNALTGFRHDSYGGLGNYWQPFAEVKGYTCARCQFVTVPAVEYDEAVCEQWQGKAVDTCLHWMGAEDPVVIYLLWRLKDILDDHGADLELEYVKPEGKVPYVEDLAGYRDLLALAAKLDVQREAELERRKREAHLENMQAYWQAQPAGLGSPFLLDHVQAHACRRCRHYRPALAAELGAPCHYAAEPLSATWGEQTRAPEYKVLVREDGAMVPCCERFQVADMPALAAIKGIAFPKDPEGRAEVLAWLRDAAGGRRAVWGVLAWLPYDRPSIQTWEPEPMVHYVREHWDECGGDGGVARLLSVAISERVFWEPIHGQAQGAALMDPTTGAVEHWASVQWLDYTKGRVPWTYPKEWPRPWMKEQGEE